MHTTVQAITFLYAVVAKQANTHKRTCQTVVVQMFIQLLIHSWTDAVQ